MGAAWTARAAIFSCVALPLACGDDEIRLFGVEEFEPGPPVPTVPCEPEGSTSRWTTLRAPTTRGLAGIWGTTAEDFWVVGGIGEVLHYEGGDWTLVDSGVDSDLRDVHGADANDFWIVGEEGVLLHYTGLGFWRRDAGTRANFAGVFASARDDVWFVGDDGVYHWDGSEVGRREDWPTGLMFDVWASGPGDLHVAASDRTHHFDGRRFTTNAIKGGGRLEAVHGTGASMVFAVGHNDGGLPGFAKFEEGRWLYAPAPNRGYFFSLYGLVPGQFWAGADQTSVFHYDGRAWCLEYDGGVGAVTAFFGTPSSDLWAVGSVSSTTGSTRPVLLRRRSSR